MRAKDPGVDWIIFTFWAVKRCRAFAKWVGDTTRKRAHLSFAKACRFICISGASSGVEAKKKQLHMTPSEVTI